MAAATKSLLLRVLALGQRWRNRTLAARWRRQQYGSTGPKDSVVRSNPSNVLVGDDTDALSVVSSAAATIAQRGAVMNSTLRPLSSLDANAAPNSDTSWGSATAESSGYRSGANSTGNAATIDDAKGCRRPAPRQPIDLSFLDGVQKRTRVVPATQVLRQASRLQGTGNDRDDSSQPKPNSKLPATERESQKCATSVMQNPMSLVQSIRPVEMDTRAEHEHDSFKPTRHTRQLDSARSFHDGVESCRSGQDSISTSEDSSSDHGDGIPAAVCAEVERLEATLAEVRVPAFDCMLCEDVISIAAGGVPPGWVFVCCVLFSEEHASFVLRQ